MKFLSVIIPTYNRPSKLSRLLCSLSKSDSINVIVIDDGSDFVHAKNNEKICSDFGVHYKFIDNSGPSKARFEGLCLSKTQLSMFVDCDDLVSPQIFEICARLFSENKTIDLITFKSTVLNPEDMNEPTLFNTSDSNYIKSSHFNSSFYRACIEILSLSIRASSGWNQSNTVYRTTFIKNVYKVWSLAWAEDIPLKVSLALVAKSISVRSPCFSYVERSYGRGFSYRFEDVLALSKNLFTLPNNYILGLIFFIISFSRFSISLFVKKLSSFYR
ncbi:glycosyltransferase family A protein [Shewanella sp. SP2S2-6]|uniref:glycosyltransferase family A protein n=1 Tax=Shewanella sp. SP2S2-6 TaxID=3063540 RepID=UPI00288E1DE5|nr:glycosyltransferase family A protein [Shewanella sp. SP2S2-6]MDT3296874.1 glycosyltransferase family A protein [Shewanella sp. SP2S2-6]